MPVSPLQAIALIDGFNLYHAIRGLGDPRLKWCDVAALVRQILRNDEQLTQTLYYTATPDHLQRDARERHSAYVAAIQARNQGGLVVQRGHFKKRPVIIHIPCGNGVSMRVGNKNAHEEKETDVRIAVDMMDLAQQNRCDMLALVSGDSDQLPAIQRVLERFEKIRRFVILLPPGQKAETLRNLEKKWPNRVRVSQIKRAHIENSRMPERFADSDGKERAAPESYQAAAE